MTPEEIFPSGATQHFELALGAEKDLPDFYWMVTRRKRQVLYVRRSQTKTTDTTGEDDCE